MHNLFAKVSFKLASTIFIQQMSFNNNLNSALFFTHGNVLIAGMRALQKITPLKYSTFLCNAQKWLCSKFAPFNGSVL